MECPGNQGEEEGGLWPTEKAGEENAGRAVEVEEDNRSCQAAASESSNSWTKEASSGEILAKVTPSKDGLVCYAEGLTQDTFKICKEFLRPYKRCLRKLNLPKDLPEEKRMHCTRKNLLILGDHINVFLQHYCKAWEMKRWKRMLWRFVSLFSVHDEKQLWKLYRYSKNNQVAKFLKTYIRLEKPASSALSKDGSLRKMCEKWGLPKDPSVPGKRRQGHALYLSRDQPAGGFSKKKFRKASSTTGRRQEEAELMDHRPASPAFPRSEGAEVPSVSQEVSPEPDP
nr:uncharacterized protein C17orf64 homolog [Pogona vitticeps]